MESVAILMMMSCLSLGLQAQELVMMITERHNTKGTLTFRGVIYKFGLTNNSVSLYKPTDHLTPTAIDYDSVDKRVYWTDISTEQIGSADLEAKNHVLVAQLNNISYAEGLTIDSAARKLFYTDRGNKVIARIEMDGFAKTDIVTTDIGWPWGMTADTTNKMIYWVDYEQDKIETCDYSGNRRRVVTSSSVVGPTGITLNKETGRLYWCEYGGRVYSILTDGTSRRTIHRQLLTTRFMDITLYNGFLYIADRTNRNIRVISESSEADGTGILTFRHFEDITGITVFSPDSPETGCADGRYGIGCTKVCGQCSSNFHCEKTVGFCLSGCAPGYEGHRCTDVCSAGTYGRNCSSVCGNCKTGSTCHHLSGQCPSGCQPGYRGERCDEPDCSTGSYAYGDRCLPCGNCRSNDMCNYRTGACPRGCSAGWMGTNCKTGCHPNKYGEDCRKDCGYCRTGNVCEPVTGRCRSGCASGWTGVLCQQRDFGGGTGGAGELSHAGFSHVVGVVLLILILLKE